MFPPLPIPSPALPCGEPTGPRNFLQRAASTSGTTFKRAFSIRRSSGDMLSSSTVATGDNRGEDGLGINFQGRSSNTGAAILDKAERRIAAENERRKDVVTRWDPKDTASMSVKPISTSTGSAYSLEPPTPSHQLRPRMSSLAINEEFLDNDILSLIDKNLDELYTANAKSFQKASSQQAADRSALQSTGKKPDRSSSKAIIQETPTHKPVQSFASTQRKPLLSLQPAPLRTPNRATPVQGVSGGRNDIKLKPYSTRSVSKLKGREVSGFTPPTLYTTYGHRVVSVSKNASPLEIKEQAKETQEILSKPRGCLYFWDFERKIFAELVNSEVYECSDHENCTDCRDLAFINLENRAMPTSIPPEERQKIINGNRALRNIKNELENLAENGQISDEAYDAIMSQLPAESSLNASSTRAAAPVPSPSPAPTPVNEFQNMKINNDPPPPAYNNPNAPSLPTRQASNPPPKPEIARAIALYRYTEPDDCTFEVGDTISITEHLNNDWWFGKNLRTGKDGVFPVNYVQVQVNNTPAPHGSPAPQGLYGNEKSNNPYGGYPPQQYQQQGPPPPGPSNPYNSAVPPMQIANEPTENKPGKGQEMGKKFGKKLGNAAIFGAGATIGGNIVNSIF